MSDTPHIDELRQLTNRLKGLLDDPHPGLFTWCEHYNSVVDQMMEFWGEPRKPVSQKQIAQVLLLSSR